MVKGPETRGTVRTSIELAGDVTHPRDGFVLPRRFVANWAHPDGTSAVIEIEVVEGRARARSVAVTTDKPRGIGWTMLSSIPVRDIVATAALDVLRVETQAEVKMDADGRIYSALVRVPPGKAQADKVREIVQGLVGYKPDLERFKVTHGTDALISGPEVER